MTPATPPTAVGGHGSARRIGSLARAEAILLRRNPIALLTALATPVGGVLVVTALPPGGPVARPGAAVVTTLTAFALIFAVYCNLVTALVARREELVLKRLRSGEAGDAEILVGAATPAVAVAAGQIIIGTIAAVVIFGMGMPVNPLLVAAAVLLGTVVFVLLAAASTAMTLTVEMAQLTTLPIVALSMMFGGLFPTGMLPEPMYWVAQALPLTRVVDLLWLGLTGAPRDGAAGGWDSVTGIGPALLVLAAWVAVGVLAVRRFMRWEPRR